MADGLVMNDKVNILLTMLIVVVIGGATMLVFTSCQLMEINIVQRATVSEGDGTSSMQHDATARQEEDSMKLIVPFK